MVSCKRIKSWNMTHMYKLEKLKKFAEVNSYSDADQLLTSLMESVNIEKFTYTFYPADFKLTNKSLHVLCSEETNQWQQHYVTHYYDRIDPIFHRMTSQQLPLCWKIEDELAKANVKQKQFFSEALDFGMKGGFAVPIHAPKGLFANLVVQDVAILKSLKQFPNLIYRLQLLAYHYHATISRLINLEQNFNLTAREKECLMLTSQNKTAKEIAKILSITPRTVGFHIENALKKLEVSNKYQAVNKLIQSGLFI